MDAILSYHLNPLACGVAKFNLLLGHQLGVPVRSLFAPGEACHPLVSIRFGEIEPGDVVRLQQLTTDLPGYDLFLHDLPIEFVESQIVSGARRVFCANREIRQGLAEKHADVVELWAPGMLTEHIRFEAAEWRLFSFGMAHKLRADHYRHLQQLLEASGRDYRLYLSTALHEGTSFDGAFESAYRQLQGIFGSRLYFVGFLSDAAIYNHLLDAAFFCAFFPMGVRANNTSVQAALQAGTPVITNLDGWSPEAYRHGETVLDIQQLQALPTAPEELARLRQGARACATQHGWSALVARMRGMAQ